MPDQMLERARALHRQIPLIDGHNDLPWRYRELVDRAISKVDIDEHQPEYCFCGHIHEGSGRTVLLGATLAANVGKTGYLLEL